MIDNKTKIDKVKLALLSMQRHSWEQGVAIDGFLSHEDDEIVIAMAKEAAYRRFEDGRVAEIGFTNAATDPCANGIGIHYAYEKTGDEALKMAYQELLQWALHRAPRNEDGIVYHFTDKKVFWVDSLYMLPPFLAHGGYFKEAIHQIDGYIKALFNPEKKLFSHQWDDEGQSFDRELFWAAGNGWAMAGISKVIHLLPAEYAGERERLIRFVTEHISSVAKYLRKDGLFHDILDDENSFVDSYFPQMFAYTLYFGVRGGWLQESWKDLADKCRVAVNEKVDCYGLVQDSCGAPHFISSGVSPESQAFYLLMESEAKRSEK